MQVHVHHHHHLSADDRAQVRLFTGLLENILEELQMISPQVQDALDRIHQTQSLASSIKQAIDLQSGQIATLTQKVTDLQAKLDAGGTIGADDLAALSEISGDIDQVNAQLQQAIPANTSSGATQGQIGGAGVGSQAGASSGSTTDPSNPGNAPANAQDGQALDPAGNAASGGNPQPTDQEIADRGAEAAGSTAKPLAGTGA